MFLKLGQIEFFVTLKNSELRCEHIKLFYLLDFLNYTQSNLILNITSDIMINFDGHIGQHDITPMTYLGFFKNSSVVKSIS